MEGETADAMYVVFNPNTESTNITLPEGKWNVYINGDKAGTEVLETVNGTVTVDAISAMVLVQESGNTGMGIPFGTIAVIGIIAGFAGAYAGMKKSKNTL